MMDYEAEYNNRRRVPEHPAIIEAWSRDAAAWRAEARAELGIVYGSGEAQALDLFFPETERPGAPIGLFIHGGYWQGLNRSLFSHMAHGATAHGLVVAVAGYDLCPGITVAAIIDEMRDACRFLWRRFQRPILAYGHSAGGHLAAALAATRFEGDAPPDLVPACLPISGLFDLAPLIPTSINAALRLDAEEAARVSPIFWRPAAGTRMIAAVGGAESNEFLRQSHAFAAAWSAVGAMGEYREIPGANHFTVIDGLTDPDSQLTADLLRLAA